MPILDHAAVGENDVEPLTCSPSSSAQVSPTRSRSRSGESRVLLQSQASKRRNDKTDNRLADDEEELMVAFLEGNEMLWDTKATLYRRPHLKTTAWQKQAETMGKEVAHLRGWFKGMRDNLARLDKLPKSGSGQRGVTERELWTIQKMNILQKITYTTNQSQIAVQAYAYSYSVVVGYHPLLGRMQLLATSSSSLLRFLLPSHSQILTTLLCFLMSGRRAKA